MSNHHLLGKLTIISRQSRWIIQQKIQNYSQNVAAATVTAKNDEYYKNLAHKVDVSDVKPSGWDNALPFDQIPGPKPLPIVGNYWRFLVPHFGTFYNLDAAGVYQRLKELYGDVVTMTNIFGDAKTVFIYNPEDIETLFRNEGPWPVRPTLPALKHYRDETLEQGSGSTFSGLVVIQGQEWFDQRTVMNKVLMQPRIIKQYVGSMDYVAGKLIDRIHVLAAQHNDHMPDDFEKDLQKWAFESIGVVSLNKHFGILDPIKNENPELTKFISTVGEFLELMSKLDTPPLIWKTIKTPTWYRFTNKLEYILKYEFISSEETVGKYVDEVMTKPIDPTAPDEELPVAVRLAKIHPDLARKVAMDLLVGGIDTTSRVLASALYYLARYPERQAILREEARKVLPDKNATITEDVLNNSPYLKAVVKETTRLSPIGVGNLRQTVKDIVLGGYRIPKGTDVVTANLLESYSDKNYPKATEFLPERWLRSTVDELSHKNTNPFVTLPFGFGPRSCVGKRIASLEIEVAILKILRNFELSWHEEDMVFQTTLLRKMVKPLNLHVKSIE